MLSVSSSSLPRPTALLVHFSPTSSSLTPTPKTASLPLAASAGFIRRGFKLSAALRDPINPLPQPAALTLYEILKVEPTASFREIKSAYRNLAKVTHPDRAKGSSHYDFVEIRNAYETLSDAQSRALYDLSLGRMRMRMMPLPLPRVGVAGGCNYNRTPRRRSWETDQCW